MQEDPVDDHDASGAVWTREALTGRSPATS
jgi:hypothetical protein